MRTMKSRDYIDSSENITIFSRIQQHKVAEHTHDFIEMVYIESGTGTHTINGKPYHVEKGDLLLFNIDDTHAANPQSRIHVFTILLNPAFVSSELVNCHDAVDILTLTSFREFEESIDNFPPKIHFTGKHLLEIENIITSIYNEFQDKAIGYKTVLKGYLNVLLAKIFRIIYKEETATVRVNLDYVFPQILEYIEKNYYRRITLKELAANSFYAPSYFGQIFKECLGVTPMEYINQKRISEALHILREKDYPIEQVSYMVGYRDKKQFYKLFKQYTGQTPGQFRKDSNGPSIKSY